MRPFLVPLAVSLLILPSFTAAAQTLRVEAVTTSVRPNAVSSFSFHTEHARPASWMAFAAFGEAELVVTADYDIDVTNTSSMPQLAECGLELSDIYLTDNICWGTDATTPNLNLFLTETIPANTTMRLTGSIEIDRINIPYSPCQGVMGDPVHTSTGVTDLSGGPFRSAVISSDWFASPFGPASQFLSVVDLGTVLRNDLSFAMTHDLPFVAGSTGCDPLRTNSTGVEGLLEAYGAVSTLESSTILSATQLPPNAFGLFALSRTTQPATLSGFGSATLCLGTPIVRWLSSVGRTTPTGIYQVALTTSMISVPFGQISPGDTWYFQFFHRDTDPATGLATARSTNAIALTF